MNSVPMQKSGRFTSSSRAFTLTELLVVVAILVILAVTLVPAGNDGTREESTRAACANNLKQIGLGTFTYCADNDNYMPALKWNGNNNDQFAHEMFRFLVVTPPVYDAAGGPYNLGRLWISGVIVEGHTFYCPGHENTGDNLTFQFYNAHGSWPFGGDPAASNPGFVRSTYYYYPQSKVQAPVVGITGVRGNAILPQWPPNILSPPPYNTWNCVPLFKQTDIDLKRSMVTDDIENGLSGLPHTDGGRPAGINAVFGDGHVLWESVAGNPLSFDPTLMAAIQTGGTSHGNDVSYLLSLLKY